MSHPQPAPDESEPSTGPDPAPAATGGRGARAITAERFSFADAIGGTRGAVESVAPGLLFVVVYLAAGQRLVPAVVAAGGAAVLAVIARLAQRQNVTQALSGVIGVGIGVLWALWSGRAENYFAGGLLVNAAYLVATAASVLAGWPAVGVLVALFAADGPLGGGSWSSVGDFRADPVRRRAYAWATWAWVAMFAARLAVQVPLYLAGDVAWLGTAKLAMGLPLTAVVLWLSWVLVRGSARAPAPARPRPGR